MGISANAAVLDIPNKIDYCQLPKLLSQLDQLNICPGYPDEHLVSMVKNKKGIVLNSAGDVAAYTDEVCYDKQKLSETVRTSVCSILTKK